MDKLVSLLAIDADLAGSSIAGTVTEALVHPHAKKAFLGHFIRALSVGWLLATFVSPAISERLKLSKAESVAVSFIGGYAGIKILSAVEKTALKRLEKSNITDQSERSSSKDSSDDSEGVSAG